MSFHEYVEGGSGAGVAAVELDHATLVRDGAELLRDFSSLDIAARGHAIVIVTHDISEIPSEVERVVSLKGGRVFADGPKAELLNSESLSELYGIRLSVFREGEGYRAVPAT